MLTAKKSHPEENEYATSMIGRPLQHLDTPSLIVDRPVLMHNLQLLMHSVKDTPVRVRAHAKSHKCPSLARLQMQLGAIGICCQKASEAQVFAQEGIPNILISNEVVGAAKIPRLLSLSQQTALSVCVDHLDNAIALNEAFVSAGAPPLHVLVEIDVGQGRCGIAAGSPAITLIQAIAQMPGLSFQGLQAYHGTAQHLRHASERREALSQACVRVQHTVDGLHALGIACPTIAGAGTGSYLLEAASGLYNEIQPGSYVFMDADYQRNQHEDTGRTAAAFAQSLFVWAGVMSRPTADRAVVDAGLKAFSVDSGLPQVYEMPGVTYVKASDEHGVLRLDKEAATAATEGAYAMPPQDLALGDKLRIVPGHCDPTVNLYDHLFIIEDEVVVDVWPISARGALY
jgi:D-serine deaminase-like pyridoxal phosphate-dependent protein